MKILHFADAHINATQSGRWDPDTGLPVRIMDFLKSLDAIIDTAIEEEVELFLFSGDAYKNQTPVPAHQAAFDSRILRLEAAKIPTYLLVGNHDSSASMRDHALTSFKTFGTEYVKVVDTICHISCADYDIVALPWVHKSKLIVGEVIQQLEDLIEQTDPSTPNIFLGHCSVTGAKFSSERMVMLGEDLILPLQLLTQSGFDYCALGHIHKMQDLNPDRLPDGNGPPVIYPGSIESVDWGEAGEEKGFMIVELEKGQPAKIEFRNLDTRPMDDYKIKLENKEDPIGEIGARIEERAQNGHNGHMIRVKLQYPEQWAGLINAQEVEKLFPDAFSTQIVMDPIRESRSRLDLDKDIAQYSPGDLLEIWMGQKNIPEAEKGELMVKARGIFEGSEV